MKEEADAGLLESRLKRLEEQITDKIPASSGERPPWYTPEAWGERQRRFKELFAELEELRKETERKEVEA